MNQKGIPPSLRSWAKFALVLILISALWTIALAQDLTADIWLNEGHELQENGYYDEALNAYERAISLDPESADGWLGKGDVLKALFKNDSELSAPPEAVGYDFYYADYWSWRSITLSTMRRVEDARGAYEVAARLYDERLQEKPDDMDAWLNKGKALTNLAFIADFFGDGDKSGELNREALLAYDRAIELDPQSSRAWSAKGMGLSDERERLEAYDKAIELDPENKDAWTHRGFALANLAARTNNESLYEEAMNSYDTALEVDPDPRSWMDKGHLLKAMGMYNESLEAFDRAIELTPAHETNKRAYFWRVKASALDEIGRSKEAADAYNETLRLYGLNQEDPNGWSIRGYILLRMGRYGEATDALDRAIEQVPEDDADKLAFFWLKKAFALEAMNRSDEVLAAYDRILELNPEDPRGWRGLGGALLSLDENEEALAAYEKVIDLKPPQSEILSSLSGAWIGKAHALKALGRYDEALEAFDEVIELGFVPFFAIEEKGDLLMELERYDEALVAYQAAIDLYPLVGRFWHKEGLVLEAMGRGSEAEISFAMSRELGYGTPPASSLVLTNVVSVGDDQFIEMANSGDDPQTFEGLILTIDGLKSIILPSFTLGPGEKIRFHLGSGESNETDIFLNSGLALDEVAGNLTLKDSAGTLEKFAAYWTPEETARDWFEKGEELMVNGSTEEALAAYERAVELDPEIAEAWIGKGYAKSRLAFISKDPAGYNESLLSFERAIELNRSQAQAWNGKGTVLSMIGRYDEAVEAYGASLEIDPLQPWVLVGKANALWKLGRHDESIAASDEAIDAAFETVEKAYVWFERAHLFAEDGDYNGTVEALNRATELAPEDKNFWINGGVLLSAHLGRYEEALIYIDRALEIDLEDPDTWRLKGLILMNLGRDAEGLAAFEEAIELDPQNGYAWHLKGNLLQRLGRENEAEAALARADELGFTSPLGGMLAITVISATGEDEFVVIANHLEEAANLQGWTLVVDGDETRSVVLPEYILEPGAMVRVHFGAGEDSGTDLFMESGIALNDDSTSVSLRDGAGREVSFLGFETLLDRGVAMTRGSGQSEHQ